MATSSAVISAQELLSSTIVKPEWYMSGFIAERQVVILAASEGLEETCSMFAKYLAVRVSSGGVVLDRPTTKAKVLLVSTFDTLEENASDLRSLGAVEDSGLYLMRPESLHLPKLFREVEGALAEIVSPNLLVIDRLPVMRYQSRKVLNEVFSWFWSLQNIYPQLTVVFTHPCTRTIRRDVFDAIAGSILWRAETNVEILLTQEKGKLFIDSQVNHGKRIPRTELTNRGGKQFQPVGVL